MSKVTRRKHVLKEMMEDDYALPTAEQQIVRVICSRGNNLHEVESANENEDNFLASMPTKFRKNIWVKRGNFLLVDPIPEGGKVKVEISKVLTPEHIKEYTKAEVWPKRFTITSGEQERRGSESSDSGDEKNEKGDGFMVRNLNRPLLDVGTDDEDDDSDDEEDESDEENETDEDESDEDKSEEDKSKNEKEGSKSAVPSNNQNFIKKS